MSIEAINWALNHAPQFDGEDPRLRPHLAIVLIGLANHADPQGRDAWPSNETLCRYTRLSESTVRRCLQRLVELGVIRIGDPRNQASSSRPGHRPVVYDLVMGEVSYRPARVSRQEGGVSYGTDEGCHTDSGMTPEPSLNQKNKPTTSDADAPEQAELPLPLPAVSEKSAEKLAGLTLNQRATRLAQEHYERLGKMGNVPAWMKIIRKALESGARHGLNPTAVDARVNVALQTIADRNWTLTEERLANTLRGGPRPASQLPANRRPKFYQLNGMELER